MADIISVENLVEVYADGTKALEGISFNVEEGEFFGFLGPNGAGKSTTIKVLTTLLKKTSGSVTIAGLNIDKDAGEIRGLIGVQSQETVIDPDLTGRENLVLQGHFHRMRGRSLNDRVDELLKLLDLSDVSNKKASLYSSGMKKRLDLGSALVHKPKLLFLDEPTTGLDPQSRAAIWKYLEALNKKEGITIFLTTQYLEEADKLCQRLSIIDHGELIVSGSPTELKQQVGGDTIEITLANDIGTAETGLKEKAEKITASIQGVTKVVDTDSGLAAYAKNAGYLIPELVRVLDFNKIAIASVSFSSPTLDDVFLRHTGKRIRPQELVKKSTYSFGRGMRRS
jgi:daunorubicin resistance ABC transporter ATP-binding subunit